MKSERREDRRTASNLLKRKRPCSESGGLGKEMIDLDDSLRAIYFAPVEMVVLSPDRSIRMINRAAEKVSSKRKSEWM